MNELPTHCINLKAFRTSLNMNQQEMSTKLWINNSWYGLVEAGKKNPTYYFLERLVNAFPDINLNKLLFSTEIFDLYK